MNKLIKTLASLKLAVILLIVTVVALAAGTIVESARGTDAAGQLVYHALWFRILLAALGLNTFFAIAERWPINNYRIGFLVTHLAMVVILLGALVSEQLKKEGSLALWEGQQGNVYWDRMGDDPNAQKTLPFTVKLDSFEIEHYPGTMRPAQFRSRVTVIDPQAGITFPAMIQMNHELTYRGWKLFQSSYQQQGGREMSILTVSKDPGRFIVYLGYFLLLGGMSTVLGTRIVQRRAAARYFAEKAAAGKPDLSAKGKAPRKAGGRKVTKPAPAMIALPLLAALLVPQVVSAQGAPAAAPPVPAPSVVDAVRTLPIQHDGRVMPLDTLAHEALWNVARERRDWQGIDPVAVVLGWSFESQAVDPPADRQGGRGGARHRGRLCRRTRSTPRSPSSPAPASSTRSSTRRATSPAVTPSCRPTSKPPRSSRAGCSGCRASSAGTCCAPCRSRATPTPAGACCRRR